MNDPAPNARTVGELERPRFLILGTAGHIDHGKTSLIKALTGTDTDRLPEERRRGMTIELGFAELVLEPFYFGVVDVPGHERFVRTMVAGATGVDLALLAVAGDDSVMPQTVEHAEILELMGIRHGVIAITKADLVDDGLLDLVEEDIRELLHGSGLDGAPIVRVSSTTGAGLEKLRRAVFDVAGSVVRRERAGYFRMAIDRVFTAPGRGTVVTGSVIHGSVQSGDALDMLPDGGTCRIRDAQSHGRAADDIQFGRRAALNIIGVDRGSLDRGHELVTPGLITPSTRMDAEVMVLKSARSAIKPFSRLRVCMGTREVFGRIVPLDRGAMPPGERRFVQIRSEAPLVAVWGQRFILREENAARTLGGGVVLRPVARRWGRDRDEASRALRTLINGDARARLGRVLAEAGFESLSAPVLCARTGLPPDDAQSLAETMARDDDWPTVGGRRVAPTVVESVFARADRYLRRFHEQNAEAPGLPVDNLVGRLDRFSVMGVGRELLNRYVQSGRAVIRGRFVALAEFAPRMSHQDDKIYAQALDAIHEAAFQPPTVAELTDRFGVDGKRVKRIVTLAVAFGELVEIDGTLFLSVENEARLRETVAGMIRESGGVSVSEIREKLNSSRKYTVPLMEHLDRIGFTKREGDKRVLCDP
jgi:selenocysteine-specific elongation factor